MQADRERHFFIFSLPGEAARTPAQRQIFGQDCRIKIGLDYTMKILDWIRIANISDLFNTNMHSTRVTFRKMMIQIDSSHDFHRNSTRVTINVSRLKSE